MTRAGLLRLSSTLTTRTRPTTFLQLRPAAVLAPSLGLRSFSSSLPRYNSPHQQATLSSTCPSCHATLPSQITPLCPSCSSLLPPPHPSTTSFSLFNLPQSYALNNSDLKRTFLQLQQKVHPDRFGGQGEQENWAKSWSGRVNEAYKVLGEGRSRGEYLLSLSDVHIGEADPVTDPELLMSIMETREALEEAETESQVQAIRDENRETMQETFSLLSSTFAAAEPDLEQAKNLLIRLKYLENVEGVCREWSPGKRVELGH
ncbi:hypothetical protein BCR35DRAFT_298453 [Leucosporidium creatinivorum]|uniref:J domain-containing protein n=1 Tax=Leucosporidium creatinivorum TaxID=106004 RepID=A0A1Y2G5U5_9BASI|nr:hypothetical protein BCR35DRAFT_298453 [Leucosporidium creatinivorum]